jgi:hypothetical protein
MPQEFFFFLFLKSFFILVYICCIKNVTHLSYLLLLDNKYNYSELVFCMEV